MKLKLSEMLKAQAKQAEPVKRKNWKVKYYNKKDKFIGSLIIRDRTEHEAENEAMGQMPYECTDWTLIPTERQPKM